MSEGVVIIGKIPALSPFLTLVMSFGIRIPPNGGREVPGNEIVAMERGGQKSWEHCAWMVYPAANHTVLYAKRRQKTNAHQKKSKHLNDRNTAKLAPGILVSAALRLEAGGGGLTGRCVRCSARAHGSPIVGGIGGNRGPVSPVVDVPVRASPQL